MAILFVCVCGKRWHAPDDAGGKAVACPGCGVVNVIPLFVGEEEESVPAVMERPAVEEGRGGIDSRGEAGTGAAEAKREKPRETIGSAATALLRASERKRLEHVVVAVEKEKELPRWRRYLYFGFLLALIPLVLVVFFAGQEDARAERIRGTIKRHIDVPGMADLQKEVDGMEDWELYALETGQEVCKLLPSHRLDGAMLSFNSWLHWPIALVSAGIFFVLMTTLFPVKSTNGKSLFLAGLFTGTVGVAMLFAVQLAAFYSIYLRMQGFMGFFFDIFTFILHLIAIAYYLAENTQYGFLPAFIGFTLGVGLCEEMVKAVPLLMRAKPEEGKKPPTWQALVLWGLASGVGFGVSEALSYAGNKYNGLDGVDTYLVRFISCVVLHGMWSGAAGLMLYPRIKQLNGAGFWKYAWVGVQSVWVSMVLHGLYDVLLTQGHEWMALVAALASFGWLAYLIETMRMKDRAVLAMIGG